MLKNILKLEGAQKLSKNEQKEVKGGRPNCYPGFYCPKGQYCLNGQCVVLIELPPID
jgi:hypothetical protein